jgi:hypothetical protein
MLLLQAKVKRRERRAPKVQLNENSGWRVKGVAG